MNAVSHADVCNQPPETGRCRAYFRRYYYDPANKSCQLFIYGGCGGNENRFETKEECEARCMQGSEYSNSSDRYLIIVANHFLINHFISKTR